MVIVLVKKTRKCLIEMLSLAGRSGLQEFVMYGRKIEFIGSWEQFNNPDFNSIDSIETMAGQIVYCLTT